MHVPCAGSCTAMEWGCSGRELWSESVWKNQPGIRRPPWRKSTSSSSVTTTLSPRVKGHFPARRLERRVRHLELWDQKGPRDFGRRNSRTRRVENTLSGFHSRIYAVLSSDTALAALHFHVVVVTVTHPAPHVGDATIGWCFGFGSAWGAGRL